MKAHSKEEFDIFMSQLKETNQTLDFFCDFDKIQENVDQISLSLNTLNYLIGKDNIEQSVKDIWNRDKKAFEVLGILIAVRDQGSKKVLDNIGKTVLLRDYFTNLDSILTFLKETGLEDVFKKRCVKDLVDFVFGIETGLDTNARKNRSGHVMENVVAQILNNHSINFRQEVKSSEFPELTILGTDEKRFDFIIETASKKYLVEVNFYSGGGSKLNEVARSYTELAPKVNSVRGFEFVWITDGIGWNQARNKLEEAFYTIPSVYNLTSIKEFIRKIEINV